MCGIAGIWEFGGGKIDSRTICRFIGALAHRGPDGQGVSTGDDGRLALAHRRLKIIGLSAAAEQPMRSPSGRYEITYNGEIYNFVELRAELEQVGFRFRTDSDTEVILASMEQWGADCLLRFNGMWSFAIWDHADHALFLSRDRFGVKPLYFHLGARRFAFASELKAFLHLDGFDAVPNDEALKARLGGNFADHLLLRDVECLPPGHYLAVKAEGSRRVRWWNTLDHLVSVPRQLARQAEDFRELLFDACRLRVRSDVPAATLLSGGLDSSSVLCSLAASQAQRAVERQAPDWRRAFIAAFPGTPQNESVYANAAAERAGAIPIVHEFSGDEVCQDIDAYLYQFEEIGGLWGLSAWALYRELRRAGFYVTLEGHGGDELLAGYHLHVVLAIMSSGGLLAAPFRTLDLVRTLHHMYGASEPEQFNRTVMAALSIPMIRALARYLPGAQRTPRTLPAIIHQHSFNATAAVTDAEFAEEQAIRALGPLTGALYRSFHRHSLPRILRNFDVHSMGHAVEARMPLLDWRVVCYAFSTPDESKISRGFTKRLLREAMQDVLPEAVRLRRHKLGYNAPIEYWLNSHLGEWLWCQVNDKEFLGSELWDGPHLLALARARRKSRREWLPAEVRQVLVAVTAHWWRTRWLKFSVRSGTIRG